MDLRKHAVSDTAFLHLRDATDELLYVQKTVTVDGVPTEVNDEDKPIGITLYGPGSKPFAKANAAKNNRMIDRLKKKGKSDMSAEENIKDNAAFLAAVTKSFHHIERDELQGEDLFLATYNDISIGFIADQATEFLKDWGNFSKG